MRTHKETFYQPVEPEVGLPGTWVVQYYDDTESGLPLAEYFGDDEAAAREFESELTGEVSS